MNELGPKQIRELRRYLSPEIEQRSGQALRPDNVYLGRLTRECRIEDLASVDQLLLTQLIVESGWASAQHPQKDVDRWIARRYHRSRPAVDDELPPAEPVPLLGSEAVLLDDVTVIGGSGWPLKPDRSIWCVFSDDRVEINASRQRLLEIPYDEIEGIQLHGGAEASGGGFIGGGFGLEGAAFGIMAATALNALTTTTKTHTLIEITTCKGELFLLYKGAEPGALRILLSHAFTRIRVSQRPATDPAAAPSLPKGEGLPD
jgi:hypothetical protein